MSDAAEGKLAIQRVVIVNRKGMHARASAKFSKLAAAYDAHIEVMHDGITANATSIMDLLMLVAAQGCEVEIRGQGSDAAEAVSALASLIADGFGELGHKDSNY